ncbi:hypothetical protein [Sphingobacterium corticibacter]|uniref:Uncharacterized protein n=1 Tax=Sphingobacterium corticibacter TaxID=2171749 RepID=A0A2T8HJ51_9SPHI|nr:hypothetical protein [Sphingobacterium corticibacter]PVH25478.1 hypothetical protein DC487_10770 [Sphingobacterium corticibacter]
MGALTSDKKIELIQWLSTLEDQEIIEKLIKFKQQETKDWWNLTTSEERSSIEKGISDADSGEVSPHSTARKLYEKWL